MGNPEAAVREYPSVLAVALGYGLEVTNYAAAPGGYLLEAVTGKYWLKPFAGSEKELSFVVAASEHLVQRGFPFLTRCLRLTDGSPGIRFRRVLFHLVEAAPGPAPELGTEDDLRAAGARLGWLHLAARAFDPPVGLTAIRTEWGSCEREFKERLLDLYDFQETCIDRPRPTRFDVLYLEHFNDIVDAAREAVDIVADVPLARMVNVARQERQFCHGDFRPSALAVDSQGELIITDLEMTRFDLRAADIAELIRATHNCDASRADAVLTGYHGAFPLTREDVRLVEAYLRFPRDCWRAANAYYREGINARARLMEAVANSEAERRFLDAFRCLEERFPSAATVLENEAESWPAAPLTDGANGLSPANAADDSGVLGDSPPDDRQPAMEEGRVEPSEPDVVEPPLRIRRRLPLAEPYLFEEPLPPRRREPRQPGTPAGNADALPDTVPETPAGDADALPDTAPETPAPTEPATPESAQPAVEPPPASPPAPASVSPPDAGAPTTTIAPGERRRLVWKFPAPMVRREDKQA
ncbi:MAG: phosphotransferase [Chloroflexota bacterium]